MKNIFWYTRREFLDVVAKTSTVLLLQDGVVGRLFASTGSDTNNNSYVLSLGYKENTWVKIDIIGIGNEGLDAINCIMQNNSSRFEIVKKQTKNILHWIDGYNIDNDAIQTHIALVVFGVNDFKSKMLLDTLEVIQGKYLLTIAAFNGFSKKSFKNSYFANDISNFVDAIMIVPDCWGNVISVVNSYGNIANLDGLLIDPISILTKAFLSRGVVCIDINDFKDIFSNAGLVSIGTGIAKGEDRGIIAGERALLSLSHQNVNMSICEKVFMNIDTSSDYLKIENLTDASDTIYKSLNEDCEIVWKDTINEALGDILRVSVFAS